jgi:hypothetical protein
MIFGVILSLMLLTSSIGVEIYNTSNGPVYSGDPDSNGIRIFRSLPFAAPPTEDLRWQPPQPLDSWDEPLDVSSFPAMCKQSAGYPGVPADHSADSEDCLYLYLYTTSPPMPIVAETSLKPVLLFIHGGGLTGGSAWNGGTYDGSALALSQDVVVVSAQYRLGALGFLAHEALSYGEDGLSRGNFGALDQRAAMQWVQVSNFSLCFRCFVLFEPTPFLCLVLHRTTLPLSAAIQLEYLYSASQLAGRACATTLFRRVQQGFSAPLSWKVETVPKYNPRS